MTRKVAKELQMLRSLVGSVLAVAVMSIASPVWAAEKGEPVAPSAAVAAAWKKEAAQREGSSTALKALYGSYGALNTLDMVSTIRARQRGAREVNPVMAGGYGQATAIKALLSAGTVAAVRALNKKSHKAAVVTMIALNVATAAVVANNIKNVHQLNQR